ncbi:Protein of unknown function [Halopseudomonas litoralis]|uniref:DUF3325 domain-containing protein n=1 Tax=Halopseudomonas litoralis TaxID=797277 RepID=A0A1H1V7T6_9GAMM|nr:DUF3325 domain-containing protein [Halopseudomonas litoralis]SDS80792.1 Protein of unknown function [Halopseudomonas litoralis]
MISLSLALCISAFGSLCLGMPRHFEQALKRKPHLWASRALRWLGWLLLGLAIMPAVDALGPSVGLALWASALTIAAMGQALLLTYRPRLIVPVSLLAPLLVLPLLGA